MLALGTEVGEAVGVAVMVLAVWVWGGGGRGAAGLRHCARLTISPWMLARACTTLHNACNTAHQHTAVWLRFQDNRPRLCEVERVTVRDR